MIAFVTYLWDAFALHYPIWLLFAIPLAATLWLWPLPSKLLNGLRIAALVCLVLALSGLVIRLPSRVGTIVLIVDRSRSMPHGADQMHRDVIELLRDQKDKNDRLEIIAFGERAAREDAPVQGEFPGFLNDVGGEASNLAEALRKALALIPRDSPGRILVLSDGQWTGSDPAPLASWAASQGIAIDYRHVRRLLSQDLAIAQVEAPATVTPSQPGTPGEAFLITAWIHAPAPQEVTVELHSGKSKVAAETRLVPSGSSRFIFPVRAGPPGTEAFEIRVLGPSPRKDPAGDPVRREPAEVEDDPVLENNRARILVGVQGPRPLLHVGNPRSELVKLLRQGGMPVESLTPDACEWSLQSLSKYSGVLLENVPADQVGLDGMETLAAWVKETGSGLMMTGGRSSFGMGGYYQSPLDPILPVSLELRKEHRKFSVALVVALDRSGSMTAPVAGGKVKMDLANQGAAEVLTPLVDSDEFGALAVDTKPHVVAPFGPVESKNKTRLRSDLLGIRSEGGGIYVFEALSASYEMLQKAKAGTRHIILFADTADAEEPGQWKDLVKKGRADNITVSVIGLGKSSDKDVPLLEEIAREGGGRCFITDKPEELPRLFQQDTFAVARSTFITGEEPIPIQLTPRMSLLTRESFTEPPAIGGYNLCYLREEANQATVSRDEFEAPVVASWQAGLGRVLCYTGAADDKQYSGPIKDWADIGKFYTSLARWTVGDASPLPHQMVATQTVRNGICVVQLYLDPRRKAEPFTILPRVTTLRGTAGQKPQTESRVMEWSSPHTLAVEIPLHGAETAISTLALELDGSTRLAQALPPVCLPYSPEFRPVDRAQGLASLEYLARATQGKERIAPGETWKDLLKRPRRIELAPWLALAALVLFLLEVLERRTGLLSWPRLILWRRERGPASIRQRGARAQTPTTAEPAPPSATDLVVQAPPARPEEASMLDALRKARQRARERTEREGK
jgi:Mg-chelatase subunit ChlD